MPSLECSDRHFHQHEKQIGHVLKKLILKQIKQDIDCRSTKKAGSEQKPQDKHLA